MQNHQAQLALRLLLSYFFLLSEKVILWGPKGQILKVADCTSKSVIKDKGLNSFITNLVEIELLDWTCCSQQHKVS